MNQQFLQNQQEHTTLKNNGIKKSSKFGTFFTLRPSSKGNEPTSVPHQPGLFGQQQQFQPAIQHYLGGTSVTGAPFQASNRAQIPMNQPSQPLLQGSEQGPFLPPAPAVPFQKRQLQSQPAPQPLQQAPPLQPPSQLPGSLPSFPAQPPAMPNIIGAQPPRPGGQQITQQAQSTLPAAPFPAPVPPSQQRLTQQSQQQQRPLMTPFPVAPPPPSQQQQVNQQILPTSPFPVPAPPPPPPPQPKYQPTQQPTLPTAPFPPAPQQPANQRVQPTLPPAPLPATTFPLQQPAQQQTPLATLPMHQSQQPQLQNRRRTFMPSQPNIMPDDNQLQASSDVLSSLNLQLGTAHKEIGTEPTMNPTADTAQGQMCQGQRTLQPQQQFGMGQTTKVFRPVRPTDSRAKKMFASSTVRPSQMHMRDAIPIIKLKPMEPKRPAETQGHQDELGTTVVQPPAATASPLAQESAPATPPQASATGTGAGSNGGVEVEITNVKSFELDPDSIQIKEEIGVGATCRAFKAVYDGKEVALKHCSEECLSFSLEGFLQEVSVLSQLSHPNIIKFYGACTKNPAKYYLVTEFLPYSVDKMISEKKKLDLSTAYAFGISTARGMDYLHSVGFAHLDLKPGNLMIGRDNLIRIIDFGSAQLYAKGITGNYGTVQYTAPEIFMKERYFEKVDVFSFGVTLNELITGVIPFSEVESYAIPDMIMKGQRPSLPEETTDTIKQVSKLITQCWAPKPSKRPSFTQIVFEMSKLLGDMGTNYGLNQVGDDVISVSKTFLTFGMEPGQEWPQQTVLHDSFEITSSIKDSHRYEIQINSDSDKLQFQCSTSGTVSKRSPKVVKVKLVVTGKVNANAKLYLHFKGFGTHTLFVRARADISVARTGGDGSEETGFFGVPPEKLPSCVEDGITVPTVLSDLKALYFGNDEGNSFAAFSEEPNKIEYANFRTALQERSELNYRVSIQTIAKCFKAFYIELPTPLFQSIDELVPGKDYSSSNPLLEYVLRFFGAIYAHRDTNGVPLDQLSSLCTAMTFDPSMGGEVIGKLIEERVKYAQTFVESTAGKAPSRSSTPDDVKKAPNKAWVSKNYRTQEHGSPAAAQFAQTLSQLHGKPTLGTRGAQSPSPQTSSAQQGNSTSLFPSAPSADAQHPAAPAALSQGTAQLQTNFAPLNSSVPRQGQRPSQGAPSLFKRSFDQLPFRSTERDSSDESESESPLSPTSKSSQNSPSSLEEESINLRTSYSQDDLSQLTSSAPASSTTSCFGFSSHQPFNLPPSQSQQQQQQQQQQQRMPQDLLNSIRSIHLPSYAAPQPTQQTKSMGMNFPERQPAERRSLDQVRTPLPQGVQSTLPKPNFGEAPKPATLKTSLSLHTPPQQRQRRQPPPLAGLPQQRGSIYLGTPDAGERTATGIAKLGRQSMSDIPPTGAASVGQQLYSDQHKGAVLKMGHTSSKSQDGLDALVVSRTTPTEPAEQRRALATLPGGRETEGSTAQGSRSAPGTTPQFSPLVTASKSTREYGDLQPLEQSNVASASRRPETVDGTAFSGARPTGLGGTSPLSQQDNRAVPSGVEERPRQQQQQATGGGMPTAFTPQSSPGSTTLLPAQGGSTMPPSAPPPSNGSTQPPGFRASLFQAQTPSPGKIVLPPAPSGVPSPSSFTLPPAPSGAAPANKIVLPPAPAFSAAPAPAKIVLPPAPSGAPPPQLLPVSESPSPSQSPLAHSLPQPTLNTFSLTTSQDFSFSAAQASNPYSFKSSAPLAQSPANAPEQRSDNCQNFLSVAPRAPADDKGSQSLFGDTALSQDDFNWQS